MTTKLLCLFPGQGSQRVGMGRDLFESSTAARSLFLSADEVLGFELSKICFEGPPEKLALTAISQPAILTVSLACFEVFRPLMGENKDTLVVASAGHSLGEYSALVAAGALSFEDAVQLVHKRGTYMQEAVPPGKGKMAAVVGKELAEVEQALMHSGGVAEIANVNAPGQVVIAGEREAVDRALSALSGARIVELQVSAPFHCSLMKPAEEKLAAALADVEIEPARFPVYCNYSGAGISQPEEIRTALIKQVCGRVRWIDCIQNSIAENGITQAIEFGCGSVLTGLLKRICPNVPRANVDSLTSAQAVSSALQL